METLDRDKLIFKYLKPSDFDTATNSQIALLFGELNNHIKQHSALEIAQTEETVFVVCLHGDQIVGMAMMATYKVVSGFKGMIEDVVVSEQFRGHGIGKKLIQYLLEEAQNLKLDEILLFSGHHRKAAIALYTSLGFVLKNSGLYRLPLS